MKPVSTARGVEGTLAEGCSFEPWDTHSTLPH